MLVCIVPGAKSEYAPDSKNFFYSKGFIYFLAILGSCVTGFGAAIIWVGQGGYIAESSNQKNLGTNMGIFQSIFSFAMVICFLFIIGGGISYHWTYLHQCIYILHRDVLFCSYRHLLFLSITETALPWCPRAYASRLSQYELNGGWRRYLSN